MTTYLSEAAEETALEQARRITEQAALWRGHKLSTYQWSQYCAANAETLALRVIQEDVLD